MSAERDIIDELDAVHANIRRAEQNIIGKDSSDKLKVVNRHVDSKIRQRILVTSVVSKLSDSNGLPS